MERFAFDFLFFAVFVFFYKTVFHQFLFDLHQIIGGEIFCNQGDGFTQSLEFPMKASQ